MATRKNNHLPDFVSRRGAGAARPAAPASNRALVPLGAMMLAGSLNAGAQQAPEPARTLPGVTVTEKAEAPEGKDALRATTTSIGKGTQDLRDVPQSLTVVTEKLIDDRNLNTLKDVLHNTAGVTFQAAEGGEEDIRLRGFSLAGSGDIFVDGMHDPAFYDRDTFANDRVELLRGSASMLFGHGSTGGVVNQVTKQARAIDQSEITTTLGNFNYRRIEGDFNIKTSEDAGIRIDAMYTKADNNGAGSPIEKNGIAATYRWNIGGDDEFAVSLYDLQNRNGISYGIPWLRASSTPPGNAASTSTIIPFLDPSDNFGYRSDRNYGSAEYATLNHIHRFADDSELSTKIRRGFYTRDLRGGAPRFTTATGADNIDAATRITLGTQTKVQDFNAFYVQSDYSKKFDGWGLKHELLGGIDYSHEQKQFYTATGAFVKPTTTLGNPNSNVYLNDPRVFLRSSQFDARNLGIYVQDLVQVAPHWKLLGGLRHDRFDGDYDLINTASGAITSSAQQRQGVWSKRAGVLYQPDDRQTFYFSYGTSFNTSGDTYSYGNNAASARLNANTDPEGSENFELGARIDSADKRFTTRVSLFRTIKTNERNTDIDNLGVGYLLTGKRHAQGVELDFSGRLTPQWEVFGSYVWTPDARIDKAGSNPGPGEAVGQRAWLTPLHSGTVWTTYQLTPQLRVGGGVTFRSKQQPNRNPGFYADSFVTADLMAEYALGERYVLKANISNITNKLYADTLYTSFYVPGPGRLIQLSLTAKF